MISPAKHRRRMNRLARSMGDVAYVIEHPATPVPRPFSWKILGVVIVLSIVYYMTG